MSDISDGTSNTILISESILSPAGTGLNRGGVAMAVASKKPSLCRAKLGANGTLSTPHASPSSGYRWADGRPIFNGFSTVMPPNSLNCSITAQTGSVEGETLVTASSYHPGGVNVAMADGAAVFIQDAINAGSATASTNDATQTQGPSHFGIWGGLGTINGTEQVKLGP